MADGKKYLDDLYNSSSLFCFSFVIDNANLDCENSNIYSCILSLLNLHEAF